VATVGQPALRIENLLPDGQSVQVYVPYAGKVTKTAGDGEVLSAQELFVVKSYSQDPDADPFAALRQAWDDAKARERAKARAEEEARARLREEAKTQAIEKARAREKRDGPWVIVLLCVALLVPNLNLIWMGGAGVIGGYVGVFGVLFLVSKYDLDDFVEDYLSSLAEEFNLGDKFSEIMMRVLWGILLFSVSPAFGWVFAFGVSIAQGVLAKMGVQ
jgi:hypothetical protein